jgi:hypothetical protein
MDYEFQVLRGQNLTYATVGNTSSNHLYHVSHRDLCEPLVYYVCYLEYLSSGVSQ